MLARQIIPINPSRAKFRQLALMLQEGLGGHGKEVQPNHWMFEVKTKKNRTQLIHFLLKEQSAGEEDSSRLVIDSPIGRMPHRFNLEWLMRENAGLDVGAICIEDFRNEDNELVTYLTHRASHRVDAADLDSIWETIQKVAYVADGLEEDIFAHDVC